MVMTTVEVVVVVVLMVTGECINCGGGRGVDGDGGGGDGCNGDWGMYQLWWWSGC